MFKAFKPLMLVRDTFCFVFCGGKEGGTPSCQMFWKHRPRDRGRLPGQDAIMGEKRLGQALVTFLERQVAAQLVQRAGGMASRATHRAWRSPQGNSRLQL